MHDKMRLTWALLLGIMKRKNDWGDVEGLKTPAPLSFRNGLHSRSNVPRPRFRVALHIIILCHGKKIRTQSWSQSVSRI